MPADVSLNGASLGGTGRNRSYAERKIVGSSGKDWWWRAPSF
jgi:hypothetical protein